MNSRFYISPGENELIKTEIVLNQEKRSALYGNVKSPEGKPIPEALIMLFLVNKNTAKYEAATYSDEDGFFILPLTAGQTYLCKVFKEGQKLRELEITTIE